MKRRSLLVVFASAAALSGCGPALPPAGNYATVSGIVTDRTSNQPIANVAVTVDSVFVAITDASGHYRVTNVPFGPWSYIASAPNYTSVSDTSPPDLLAGENRNFPIALQHS